MIKPSDLKTQSNNTFFDNDQGLINPAAHRTFNNAVIDYIQAGQPATFVVDSNDTLTAWVSNTAGNVYTHVLIKPGTFQTSKTINLATSGTKTVVGMGGSKIVKSGGGVGIQGNNSHDCKLIGVNVEVPSGAPTTAFHSCSHLIGCYGKVMCYGSDNYGTFYNCQYLTDCVGYCTAQNTYACVFGKCQYLNNCYAVSGNTSQNYAYGFMDCDYLTNCKAEASGAGGNGFMNCTGLMNCIGKATGTGMLNSCGFINCIRLTHCGSNAQSSGGSGIGFNTCKCLFGCYAEGASKTTTYSSCYMSQVTNKNPVGDTAEGGYNLSLNAMKETDSTGDTPIEGEDIP